MTVDVAIEAPEAADLDRFAGVERLYGPGALRKFADARVIIVGLGGVGSWAAEALVRSGVQRLALLDGDEVCISNTNRQLHAHAGNFGRSKVVALGERLLSINPKLQLDLRARFLLADRIEAEIDSSCDVVLDAIDSFKAKVALIYHCRRNKIPIVVSGAAGGRTDPTQLRVRDLSKTEHDMLLGLVRRKLRDDYGWTRNPKRYFGVQAVYSLENVRYPVGCSQDDALKLDCSGGLGAVMHVTAAFGMIMAKVALERLLASRSGPSEAAS